MVETVGWKHGCMEKYQRNEGSCADDAFESGMSLVVDFGGRQSFPTLIEWNNQMPVASCADNSACRGCSVDAG